MLLQFGIESANFGFGFFEIGDIAGANPGSRNLPILNDPLARHQHAAVAHGPLNLRKIGSGPNGYPDALVLIWIGTWTDGLQGLPDQLAGGRESEHARALIVGIRNIAPLIGEFELLLFGQAQWDRWVQRYPKEAFV